MARHRFSDRALTFFGENEIVIMINDCPGHSDYGEQSVARDSVILMLDV